MIQYYTVFGRYEPKLPFKSSLMTPATLTILEESS